MKKIMLFVALFAGCAQQPSWGQMQDPTGFSQLVVNKIKDTQAGGSIRLQDGKVGTLAYLPIKKFHSNNVQWLWANAGVESIKDEKVRGILFPSTDIIGLADWALFSNAWAKAHVAGSDFPPIQVGMGPAIPLDYPTLKRWTWDDLRRSLRLTASVRFGDVVK